MKLYCNVARVCSGALLLAPVWALPAPQASGASTVEPDGPPGALGFLRGPASLLGHNPSIPIPTEPSTVIPPSEFELAPGQSEDAELGLFIDLSKVKNPQPIRGGTVGPTDPGPRYVSFSS
jgi:hypothetical protein